MFKIGRYRQTLFLEPTLCLCDCPGLVFPSFVNTKAELVINGIMPVDNITHYMKVFTLLAAMIPRHVFESVCKMVVDCPRDTGVDNTYATAEEILNALACKSLAM
ncbi:LSG1 [Cordylochernes scorpioides]|uniref:LSG1 n=1 Tax=Cordylochernes scorpioides TaxID=51811 RepID=A0ABY6KKN7_9ARAC|nr:LSG1 [Cordylochernes scorpioides]